MSEKCSEAGCPKPVKARGLCGTHYMQLRRGRLGKPPLRLEGGQNKFLKIRISKDLVELIEKAAMGENVNVSKWMRSAMEKQLSKTKKPAKKGKKK